MATTNFNQVWNSIVSVPKAYYWSSDTLDGITLIPGQYMANPNVLSAQFPNTPFTVTERMNPNGYNAISHEVAYNGGGNVIIEGDNKGYAFCSDSPVPGSTAKWGRPGIYNGPARSNNDILSGGSGHDILYGLTGNDTLYGNHGNDILYGGTGNDELHGGTGTDFLFGDSGDDMLYGDSGDDWLEGGAGDDELYGGDGDDSLNGGIGDDILDGGTGNDTLYGGGGTNVLTGGEGDDTYIFKANSGIDFVVEMPNEGYDICKIEVLGLGDVSFFRNGDHLQIADNAFSSIMQFQNWFSTFAIDQFQFADIGFSASAEQIASLFGVQAHSTPVAAENKEMAVA